MRLFVLFAFLAFPLAAAPESPDAIAKQILAPLLDPAKVATLKRDRPANARLYKVLGWLETARQAGGNVSAVIDTAQAAAGYAGTKGAAADKAAIVWSRTKLESWGCFTPEGLAELRKGGSPTITKGEHAGTGIALDHVLPRSVVPELEARFYNLEAIPAKDNLRKGAAIGKRELDLARRWKRDGLLSAKGLAKVESAAK
ncbi:MAG: hypothetical protein V4819_11235 [Verrucomicrobiota bacterium]